MKNCDFGGPGPGLAQGLETGFQKHHSAAKPLTLLGVFFRVFLQFLTFNFSFIFGVTADTELWALWRRKDAQKEVCGEPFRRDFEVSAESENEAPV